MVARAACLSFFFERVGSFGPLCLSSKRRPPFLPTNFFDLNKPVPCFEKFNGRYRPPRSGGAKNIPSEKYPLLDRTCLIIDSWVIPVRNR